MLYTNHNAGCVTAKENYMHKLFLIGSLILLTSCNQFALLASAGSIGLSQNVYAKAYNSLDVLTLMGTKKSIKTHIYDQGKKIYDEGKEIYDGR